MSQHELPGDIPSCQGLGTRVQGEQKPFAKYSGVITPGCHRCAYLRVEEGGRQHPAGEESTGLEIISNPNAIFLLVPVLRGEMLNGPLTEKAKNPIFK